MRHCYKNILGREVWNQLGTYTKRTSILWN
jgi:hypothetical protein